MGKITAIILILAACAPSMPDSVQRQTADYYVSPDGSDRNRGTINRPWRTLAHALEKLSPGDVLYLRGGTYYEYAINVNRSGSASAPITIQSYPGERAVIDGGVPYFRNTPNSEWELVNGDIHLYRSRRTFLEGYGFVRAWLVDSDVQLVEYESVANIESANYGPLDGLQPVYVGPGIQLRRDGHLYIRLAYNPNDLTDASGNPISPSPVDINPNHNELGVSFSGHIFVLDGASYLHFKDLDFSHAQIIMDVRNGSHHVTLSGCHMNYGSRGLVIREGVHDWEIYNCEFNNGLPDYVYWADVKNKGQDVTEAYPEFQSAAIDGSMVGFQIHHNLFRNAFDGLTVDDGATDTRITNNIFNNTLDDAINLSKGIRNVEVAHNLLWRVMSGISNLSSDQAPGHVYIHHNIIDNSAYHRGGRPGNYREDNWPVWTVGSPFPDHDEGNKASWWKLYNNTIVTRQDNGHRWASAGPDNVTGNPEKYVFNNIFYVLDERVIFRNELASSGSHYDGNVFYRTGVESLPLFSDFGDGGRYDSLHDFRADSGTDWEMQGLEADPGFDPHALDDPLDDPLAVWERYLPTTTLASTPGVDYQDVEWPGTQGVKYRGAVPPLLGELSIHPFLRTTRYLTP